MFPGDVFATGGGFFGCLIGNGVRSGGTAACVVLLVAAGGCGTEVCVILVLEIEDGIAGGGVTVVAAGGGGCDAGVDAGDTGSACPVIA